MNKQELLSEKIKNFTKFVKEKLGEDNEFYKDCLIYNSNIEKLISDMISLHQLVNGLMILPFMVKTFLEKKNIKNEISEEDLRITCSYLNMFVRISIY
jgi:hypothetical protein